MPRARSSAGRLVGLGGILAAGALAFYLLVARPPTGLETTEPSAPTPTMPAPVHANVAPAPVAPAPAPWEATRKSSPPVSAGQVPAWLVHPPAPDPATHMPAAPVPPPEPQTTTPPMDNPGGVNGDRPPRDDTP